MIRALMTSNIVIQIGNGPAEERRERCHIPLRVVVGHGELAWPAMSALVSSGMFERPLLIITILLF